MKKYFLSITTIIALGITIVSCQGNNEKKSEVKDSVVTNQSAAESIPSTTVNDGVPIFNNEGITQYCRDYKAMVDEYSEIVNNKKVISDTEMVNRVEKLTKQVQEQDLENKILPEEREKFTNFMSTMATQLANIGVKNIENQKK